MNIGILNEMVASTSKVGSLALEGADADVKYVSAPETNLVKRIAYGEMYTTNAARLQSSIWLSHVCTISPFLNINSEVVSCSFKLKS